jgi:hypothetical protein
MKVFRIESSSPLTIELETPQEARVMHAILRQVDRLWFKPTNEIGEPLSEPFATQLGEFAAQLAPLVELLYPHHTGQHHISASAQETGTAPTWRCGICSLLNPDDADHCRQCEYSRMVLRDGKQVPRNHQR